uniref:Perilipin n=1 Tax=Strigops habroptila TaxID=2489341 RepID=A0A672U868_STRHB
MASAMPDKEEDAVNQVASLTLVSSACDMVSTAYTSTKESHPYIGSVCAAAEKGVKSVTEATASCVQPVLTTLEPHVAVASEYASKGLDKLGEKIPLLQKPMEQVRIKGFPWLAEGVADAKDAVSSKVMEVIDVTKETLQSSIEAARSAVTSSVGMVMDSGVSQTAVSGAEAVLGVTEDSSLPMGNEELEGADTMPVEQQQEKRRYFVRLRSLPDELRLFAYLHSTDKMKQVWQGMQEALAQLHSIIDLIEVFKQGFNQKLQEQQEKLHQMWLDWSRKSSKEGGDNSSAEPESLALLLACSITQQLQITCCKVVSAIQGLPSSLQDKVKLLLTNTEELHASFSAAKSFQDLSSSILTQNQRKLAVIHEYMEELLDYLKNNIPLSWLVGPFSPREEREMSQEDEPLQEEGAETAGAGHHEASATHVKDKAVSTEVESPMSHLG